MKQQLKHLLTWYVPGALVGIISGYIYWYYWGCDGTCLITSSPVRSMLYFGIMGILMNQMFKPSKKENSGTSAH